jgi:predicted N-acetyltransferase YhbS
MGRRLQAPRRFRNDRDATIGGADPLTRALDRPNAPDPTMTLAIRIPDETLAPERPQDAPEVERLIACAFGPGRFAKAVERLRERGRLAREVSFVAWRGGAAAGCVRLWPIAVGEARGLLLGPIAVDADWRRHGLGADLVRRACQSAAATGDWRYVLLVGDPPFFGPLGFAAAPARGVILPGPVDRSRVLVRALVPGGADDLEGRVRALA